MKMFGYGTGPMYVDGVELNHFGFYKKHGVNHINSWLAFLVCLATRHRFKGDPDICSRCGVFVG